MAHTHSNWGVKLAYWNRRTKVMIEAPTGERFYLSPDDAMALGKRMGIIGDALGGDEENSPLWPDD